MATQLAIPGSEEFEKVRPDNPAVMFMQIISAAMHDERVDIEKLKALFELKKEWERSEAKKAYDAAIAEFKKNPPQINKNKHVAFGQTQFDHATLDHVCDQVIVALSQHGLSHRWDVQQDDKDVKVTCILTHAMGHSERTTLKGSPDASGSKNAIQAIGSAITYLERYSLLAACGLAAKGQDDDGQGGGGRLTNLKDHLDWIANCKDMTELQKFYNEAKAQARSASDQDALKKIIAAKDKRKAELQ